MAKGGTSSTTTQQIDPTLKPLYKQTGQNVMNLQTQDPITQYLGSNPTQIAPLSGTQTKSIGLMNTNLDDALKPLEDSSIVNAGTQYFNKAIAPGVIGQATLSGLGRSTALTNALGAAQAQTMLPLLQGEQARRDAMINQGLSAGDVERSVQQQGYNAEQADLMRRQALAENALFAPLSQLPSTFGQKTTTSGGSGGFLK